jgi:lipopolysaccharide/colanic/teichoic acid biosynthesis glycosyltransferase
VTRRRRWTIGIALLGADLVVPFMLWMGEGRAFDSQGIFVGSAYLAFAALLGAWSLRTAPSLTTRRCLPFLAAGDTVLLAVLLAPQGILGRDILALAGAIFARELIYGIAQRVPGPAVALVEPRRQFMEALSHAALANFRVSTDAGGLRLTPFHDADGRVCAWRHLESGLEIRRPEAPSEGMSRRCKRNIDLLFAGAAVILLLPLAAFLALLIRLLYGAPVFYRQTRLTNAARPFSIVKFRSMGRDAEALAGAQWPAKDDPRSTRLGMVLRRFWLDEIPQLVQVLSGDLSIVGPRPERPEFAQVFSDGITTYGLRYKAIAGITGLAQARGFVGNTSIRKRSLCDRIYVRRWSPCLDLWILAKTLGQVVWRTKRPHFDYVPGRDAEIP